jgi:hypothetical protein
VRHAGRRGATSGDWAELIWEQEVAGSNPAIPTDQGLASGGSSASGSLSVRLPLCQSKPVGVVGAVPVLFHRT